MKHNGYEVKSSTVLNTYTVSDEMIKKFSKYPMESEIKNSSDELLLGWYRYLPTSKNSYQEFVSKLIVQECKSRFNYENNVNEENNKTTENKPYYNRYNNSNSNYNNSSDRSYKPYNRFNNTNNNTSYNRTYNGPTRSFVKTNNS